MNIDHSTLIIRQGAPSAYRQSTFPGATRGGTVTVRYWRIPLAMTARLVVPAWSGFSVTVPTALSCATPTTRKMRASATAARRLRSGVGFANASCAETRNTTLESGRIAKWPDRLDAPHNTTSCAAGPATTLNATCFSTTPIAAITVAEPTRSPNVTPTWTCPAASVAATAGWMRALTPVNVTACPESTAPAES